MAVVPHLPGNANVKEVRDKVREIIVALSNNLSAVDNFKGEGTDGDVLSSNGTQVPSYRDIDARIITVVIGSGAVAPLVHKHSTDDITSGRFATNRMPSNVAYIDIANVFTHVNTFSAGLLTDTIDERTPTLGVTVDGVLLKDSLVVTALGTEALPSHTFVGDPNTGMYSTAADRLSLTAAGSDVLTVRKDIGLSGDFIQIGNTDLRVSMVGAHSPAVDTDGVAFPVVTQLTEAASGTHVNFVGLNIGIVGITAGGAAVTNAASVRIVGAPTAGTNNYALWVDAGNVRIDEDLLVSGDMTVVDIRATGHYEVDAVQVVSNRVTGWTAPTGTPTRSGYVTSTPPSNTVLAEHLKALIDDLITHGLIGT